MIPPIATLKDKKSIMRMRMKRARQEAAKARPDAALHAARNFMSAATLDEKSVVSVYYPIHDELDTEPLVAALIDRNVTVALPVVMKKNAPLAFRRYRPGDELITGSYGALIPADETAEIIPTIIVTPLLAFNAAGGRLGYGGGYYDRTLAEYRQSGRAVTAVGFGYGAQATAIDAFPVSTLDQKLDWAVTERGVQYF